MGTACVLGLFVNFCIEPITLLPRPSWVDQQTYNVNVGLGLNFVTRRLSL